MLNKTITALPPELFCLIMDSCSHDALNSCSMVSKTWQHTAQRLLLRKIIILMDQPTRNLSALRDFLGLQPDLAPYIHAVRIKTLSHWHVTARLSEIHTALACLPHLKSVYLGGIHIMNRPPLLSDSPDTPESPLPEIELLKLELTSLSSSFHWADGVCDVLGLFSSIGTLAFNSVDIFQKNTSPLAPPALVQRRLPSDRLQRIGGLNLAGRNNDDSIRILRECIDFSCLSSLSLEVNEKLPRGMYTQFQACVDSATHLKHVKIRPPSGNLTADPPAVSFHSCKTLETFTLSLPIIGKTPLYAEVDWQRSRSIIDTIPSEAPLRTFNLLLTSANAIHTSNERADPVTDTHWSALLSCLKRLVKLERINILVGPPSRALYELARTVYHPSIFKFFKRPLEELFPSEGPRYTVSVDFA